MTIRSIHIICFWGILLCSGCSLSKSLPEGGHVYIKSTVKIIKTDKKANTKQLETTYNTLVKQPKPNKRFLWTRWRLRRYNLFYKANKRRELRGSKNIIGKPPVIYDERITTQTRDVMKNKAFNEGFFNVEVTSKVKKRWHKAKVKYQVELREPFMLDSISNGVTDSIIKEKVRQIQGNSILETGARYSLQKLKQERERIASVLRQDGFYFFREDYLKFKADTINTNGKVKLELTLKEQIDPTHLLPKIIDEIYVFPDLTTKQDTFQVKDTIDFNGLKIIYKEKQLRHAVIRDAITLKKGQHYSLTRHQSSLERLSYLRYHQFIDIQFEQSELADTLINVIVKLTPRQRETVEGSVGLSLNSGAYLGPEVSLTYINRNLFKGAEQLRLTSFGNYSFPIKKDLPSRQEQGLKLELSKPGIIVPFKRKLKYKQLIAKTKVGLVYSSEKIRLPLSGLEDSLAAYDFTELLQGLQTDPNFAPFVALDKYELSLAYQWRIRPEIQHELTPINFIWQIPRYDVPELRQFLLELPRIINPGSNSSNQELQLNLERMFIFKPGYVFLYDSRLRKIKPHNKYYRGKIAFTGNRILLQDDLVSIDLLESQYFQLENDIRYFRRFSSRQTIGARFAIKASIPFKNEVILPFFDLYTIGGPNSVRAFRPRSVGPGSTEPLDEVFFFTGIGDFLLEGNLEWRPKINDLLELGFFVDAGNVWLFKGGIAKDDQTIFKFSNFHKQLAIGAGVGLRFDFDVIILRLDFATPLTKPWLPEGERWVGDKIALGSIPWLWNNLNLNLGFGYSF